MIHECASKKGTFSHIKKLRRYIGTVECWLCAIVELSNEKKEKEKWAQVEMKIHEY